MSVRWRGGFVWCCWWFRRFFCTCLCWCWTGTGCSEASRPLGCPPWGCLGRGGRHGSAIQPARPSAQPRCELTGPPGETHTHKHCYKCEAPAVCLTNWRCERTNLLQELNLGLQHLLHVVDFLLSLQTSSLQLCLIVIGQALRCCAVQHGKMWVDQRWIQPKLTNAARGVSIRAWWRAKKQWCHSFPVCYGAHGTPNTHPLIAQIK